VHRHTQREHDATHRAEERLIDSRYQRQLHCGTHHVLLEQNEIAGVHLRSLHSGAKQLLWAAHEVLVQRPIKRDID
jgi:hypothetical protein